MNKKKAKAGFFTGLLVFFTLLFLPPTPSMYLSALTTVLKHSHQNVTTKLLAEMNLRSVKELSPSTIDRILLQAQEILVTVPEDFDLSGEKGIRLAAESTPGTQKLRQVIELQTRGLKRTLALALLMAVWWMTEALPIVVVALLPMVLFPALSIAHVYAARMPGYFVAFTPYMHRLVVLFLGGFTIAEAMKRWNLHERIALHFISRIGFSPKRVTLGVMVATALLSMFISCATSLDLYSGCTLSPLFTSIHIVPMGPFPVHS